jgi:hypothetical protein
MSPISSNYRPASGLTKSFNTPPAARFKHCDQKTRKRVLELRRCAQAESKVEMDVQAGIFTQAELCQVSGLNSVTVDTWLIWGILRTTKVGGRTLRGRRLFSVLAIFEAKVTGELVTRLSLPPSGPLRGLLRARRSIEVRPARRSQIAAEHLDRSRSRCRRKHSLRINDQFRWTASEPEGVKIVDYMQGGKVWDLEPRKQRQVQPIDVTCTRSNSAARCATTSSSAACATIGSARRRPRRRGARPCGDQPHLLPSRRWQTALPDGQAQSARRSATRPRAPSRGTISAARFPRVERSAQLRPCADCGNQSWSSSLE